MLLYACFFRTCINPSLTVHCILYIPNSYGCVIYIISGKLIIIILFIIAVLIILDPLTLVNFFVCNPVFEPQSGVIFLSLLPLAVVF